jgi:hypothetical protein
MRAGRLWVSLRLTNHFGSTEMRSMPKAEIRPRISRLTSKPVMNGQEVSGGDECVYSLEPKRFYG